MLSEEQLKQAAQMQLQLAVINGERWALEAVLGIKKDINLSVGPNGDKKKWRMEIVHVKTQSKEKEDAKGQETEGVNSKNDSEVLAE